MSSIHLNKRAYCLHPYAQAFPSNISAQRCIHQGAEHAQAHTRAPSTALQYESTSSLSKSGCFLPCRVACRQRASLRRQSFTTIRQFPSDGGTSHSPCGVLSPGTRLCAGGSWIPRRGGWLKEKALFPLSSLTLLYPRGFLVFSTQHPTPTCGTLWAWCSEFCRRDPPNGPLCVSSRATFHKLCPLVIRGWTTALKLAQLLLRWVLAPPLPALSPPLCRSHSRGQVLHSPDLTALKITVHRPKAWLSHRCGIHRHFVREEAAFTRLDDSCSQRSTSVQGPVTG